VQEITNEFRERSELSVLDKSYERRGAAIDRLYDLDMSPMPLQARGRTDPSDAASAGGSIVSLVPTSDGTLLQEAADTLTLLVSRADQFPVNEMSMTVLDRLETALAILRRAIADRANL